MKQGYDIDTIPEMTEENSRETAVIVLASPQEAVTEPELTYLQQYLQTGGHLLLLADPQNNDAAKSLTDQWGVTLGKGIVVDEEHRLGRGSPTALQIRTFTGHDITDEFTVPILLPVSRHIDFDIDEGKDWDFVSLAQTSEKSWAEVNLTNTEPELNPEEDVEGPLTIAAALTSKSTNTDTQGSAKIVIGWEFCICNKRLFYLPGKYRFLSQDRGLARRRRTSCINFPKRTSISSIRPKSFARTGASIFPSLVLTPLYSVLGLFRLEETATALTPMAHPYRITIFLAVILFGIGSYVYFVDVPASEQAIQVKKEQEKLIPFDDRILTHVSLKTSKEHLVFGRDSRGRWLVTSPLTAPADSRELRKVLRALTLAKIERVVQESTTDLGQYGLEPSRMTVTLSDGKQKVSLELGNPGPFSSSLYARQANDNRVLLTTLNVLTFAKKTLYTYRLKDVLFFNQAKAKQLELHSPTQDIELYRVPGVHGVSPNWRFRKPFDGPADKTTVGILLMALEDLKAEAFVDTQEEKDALLNKLGEPIASATIKTQRNSHRVAFYQDNEHTYAQTSAKKPLYRINGQIVREVTKSLFGLRDKRLLGIPTDELTIVHVQTQQETYNLVKQNNLWLLEEDPGTPLKPESYATIR